MSLQLAYNNAQTTLAGAISNIATTAALAAGSGALFSPPPTNGQYFLATLNDAATGTVFEIVKITGVVGDIVTMVRGQEGTSAQNWLAGDLFVNDVTAGTVATFAQIIVNAGDPNGAVAGTAAVGNIGPTLCWDTINLLMWACTLTGPIGIATWAAVGNFQPLYGNLNLYVSTLGSDNNNGLTPATPFLTIQKAATTIQNYALNGFTAFINIVPGTYTQSTTIENTPNGLVQLQTYGNGVVTINVVGGNCINAQTGSNVNIVGNTVAFPTGSFNLISSGTIGQDTSGNALFVTNGAQLSNGAGITFGACTNYHIHVVGGVYTIKGNYTINGNAGGHIIATQVGALVSTNQGVTVTLAGTPSFTNPFITANLLALCEFKNTFITYSGAATGVRYDVDFSAIINTVGGGPNFFPGNAAGVIGTNGAPVYA